MRARMSRSNVSLCAATTKPSLSISQPRDGPLPFGHKSHQIGLDVDIWFMPMPDRVLSAKEREDISAPNLVAADGKRINDKIWSPADIAFIRTAAEQPEVERVLVNAAIKKELCRVKNTKDELWMSKVRPCMATRTTSMCV
jgi:penicillin-insensitive murein endopeptidase